jgi:hypothetical protein
MILGVCASGLAVVGAFASYTGSKYKVKTADGSFLLVRGYGCSGSGSLRCVVKVKTAHGSETVFERATLFNQHGDTVAGESYLLSTFHTLGD